MRRVFFIDESIHQRGGFILAALVCAEDDITPEIARILADHGINPEQGEYKSSSRHDEYPQLQQIRTEFLRLLVQVRLALVVCPVEDRNALGRHIITGLGKVIGSNDLETEPTIAFVDEGIEPGPPFDYGESLSRVEIRWGQSSKTVSGIQLADCVAHVLSSMLLEELDIIKKTTKAGPNSGYDEDLEFSLGQELFGWVRRRFFTQDRVDLDAPHNYAFALRVGPYGIFAAPTCNDQLRKAVYNCFGTTFVGCMH